MVQRLYAQYRDPDAVEKVNPHLHNVPMQIAAERGLPALAAWLCSSIAAVDARSGCSRRQPRSLLAATALAAIAGMLAAGMFEYNFGDSEFLMLFLVLVTLPFAAERPDLASTGCPDPSAALARPRPRHRRSASPGASVIVVGDVMLDQFLVGRVDRISPEAPVPIVTFDHEESRVGGAANVAANVAGLGGGCTSWDSSGQTRRPHTARRLDSHGIASNGLLTDPDRRTTTKMRVVTTRNQQVARVDYETDREAQGTVETALIDGAAALIGTVQAIVVSDYLKGTVTRTLVARLVALAQARGVPLLVDPKIPHLDYYAGATLVTPNHHEAEIATHLRIRERTTPGWPRGRSATAPARPAC